MATSRYTGNGFTNPLNPLSLHSENHYRSEMPIGYSFMSDERRIYQSSGLTKAGIKASAKAALKASAKASRKALAKAGSKIAKAAGSKGAQRLATTGVLTYGLYKTTTAVIGTDVFDIPCEKQAKELHEPDTPEYQEYLEGCYEDNAETFVSMGRTALIGGGILGALIIVMMFRKN